jgi:aminobenzoyl-glutamate transport protein
LYLFNASVTYEAIDPTTNATEVRSAAVNSLLTASDIRFMITSPIANFLNFNAIGVILVAMVGVGLAEEAGLINALIHAIVRVAPAWSLAYILAGLGVASSLASDVGISS